VTLFGKDVTPEGEKKQSTGFRGFWGRMAMILPRGGATCCAFTYIKDRYMKPRLRLDGVGGGVPGDRSFAEIGFVGHVASQCSVVAEDGVFGDLLVVAHALEKFP
jgi:hypothetical protein